MLLDVYNKNHQKIDILDERVIFFWELKYNDIDFFQITSDITHKNTISLSEDNIIVREDNRAGYITSYTKKENTDGSYTITAKGKCLSQYLNDRNIDGEYKENDIIPNHIKNIIEDNVINPKDSKRRIDRFNFVLDESLNGIEFEKIRYQNTDGVILEAILDLCNREDLGFRTEYIDGKIYFILYQGLDRTSGQFKNPEVVFNTENENILDQVYTYDKSSYKNVAIVAGQGQGEDRIRTIVGDVDKVGTDRREMFVDARDIDLTRDGVDIPKDEYLELLKKRGYEKLKEQEELKNYDAESTVFGNLRYKRDFNIGDKVEVVNDIFNVKLETRVTEVHEIYEGQKDIRIVFGNNVPTVADKLRSIDIEVKNGFDSLKNYVNDGKLLVATTIVDSGGNIDLGKVATFEEISNAIKDLDGKPKQPIIPNKSTKNPVGWASIYGDRGTFKGVELKDGKHCLYMERDISSSTRSASAYVSMNVSGNYEVEASILLGRISGTSGLAIGIGGDDGNESATVLQGWSDGEVRIASYNNGSFSASGRTDVGYDREGWYKFKMKVDGNTVSGKVWKENEKEPEEWQLSVNNSKYLTDGYIGIFTYNSSTEIWARDFKVTRF